MIEEKKIILTEHFTIKGIIRQVVRQRLDGAYINVEVAKYQLRLLGKEGVLRFDRELPHVDDHYYLSSTKYPNEFLIKYKNDIDALKHRYQLL